MNLPVGTLLQGGKYMITRFIGSGGFGCTYEAEHIELDEKVAIKEFFVKDFCNRDETTLRISVATQGKVGLVDKLRSKFKDEARSLYRLRHPGIVHVSDVFEENGTAYYVMDYVDGRSLQDIVASEGPLPEGRALKYVRQVADALAYVHSNNRLHLDIKPGNVMVDKSDNAILIDFGASKQYDEENGENTSTLVGKTPGYAPLEQMSNRVTNFFPATDIYALGATLYKLLTGVTPPDAAMLASGGEELAPLPFTVSANIRRAISATMSLKKDDRPQSIDGFLTIIDGAEASKSLAEQARPSEDPRPADDSTVLDENKKHSGAYGPSSASGASGPSEPPGSSSSQGVSGNFRENDYKVAKGGASDKPSSCPNRAKRWVIAVCVIVGLIAGFFLLKGLMSGGGADDGQMAALQREQYVKDSLEDVQRSQHIKDSIAAVERAEQEEAAREEAARQEAEAARSTTGKINGHEWVDLGLSAKWATCNVGASSPSEYGDYYAWGETKTKSEYTKDNCSTDGVNLGDISGDIRYDAARASWGGTWRLPTRVEIQELIDNCTWQWTTQDGQKGCMVTGPSGKSIFLPAAGCHYGGSSLDDAGDSGLYWSSTSDGSDLSNAYGLYFLASYHDWIWSYRNNCKSIRPVSD